METTVSGQGDTPSRQGDTPNRQGDALSAPGEEWTPPALPEPPRLDFVVVEVLDSHNRVRLRERVVLDVERRSFTVGRSTAADLMLDDVYAAPVHASIEVGAAGALSVTDLGSQNGVVIAGQRHLGAQSLSLPDACVQVGRTVLRIRTAQETLAPEKPDLMTLARSGLFTPANVPRIAAAGGLVFFLFLAYFAWVDAPRDLAMPLAVSTLWTMVVVGVWTAVWSLITRVSQGEWRWLTHVAIVVGVVSVLLVLDTVLSVLMFTLDIGTSFWMESGLMILAAAVALYWHLSSAASIRQRTAVLAAILVPSLIIGLSLWMKQRSYSRDVNYIAESDPIYPPSLRLRGGGTLDDYFKQAARLKDSADQRRKSIQEEDSGDDDDAE